MPTDLNDRNVQAFLKLIRYAEHYPDKSDDFYNSLYGGGRFAGYVTHPHQRVTKWHHKSDAAGAYQILGSVWDEAKRKGVVMDFTPASQDKLAYHKLIYRHALAAVGEGNVDGACTLLAHEWTSLPGGKQSRMTMAVAKQAFVEFGGTLKK